ncbi:MAG: serine hydrolase [Acetobacterales bacterium]
MLEKTSQHYFPGATENWERSPPAEAGFDAEALQQAINHAIASETLWTRDLQRSVDEQMNEPPPYNEILGPMQERGGQSGVILRGGRIVAEWGTPARVDMTFSVTKSFVSTCAGIAWDRGLIPDLHAPVRELVDDGGFEAPHNDGITWHQLLQQTSEWQGTLWDKPDWIDHYRHSDKKGTRRELREPGTYWEYNDVRVNRASLAILRVLREPLPEVLKQSVMDPIGASDLWQWHGYRNSWVEIDGRQIQSVSGGGHWGGGMFISAHDMARFGYLYLRRGEWNGRRIVSEDWVDRATTPCEQNPKYGYMLWLNGTQENAPSAPASSYFMRGAGSNVVWIDPDHDLVAVLRWIQKPKIDGFCQRVIAAIAR